MTVLQRWALWLALGIAGGLLAVMVEPTRGEAHEAIDVPSMIVDAAQRHGADADRMLRVAWCESRFDPGAYNRWDGGSAGIFQFQPRTYAWASHAAGVGGASPFDAFANVEAAAWLFARGGASHWSCR